MHGKFQLKAQHIRFRPIWISERTSRNIVPMKYRLPTAFYNLGTSAKEIKIESIPSADVMWWFDCGAFELVIKRMGCENRPRVHAVCKTENIMSHITDMWHVFALWNAPLAPSKCEQPAIISMCCLFCHIDQTTL